MEKRIIKYYPNRRLYDCTKHKYITLNYLRYLILKNIPIQIIKNSTEEDITNSTILKIMSKQAQQRYPEFNTKILENIIQYEAQV